MSGAVPHAATIPPPERRKSDPAAPTCPDSTMFSPSRDSLALYAIAATAILFVLYADVDPEALFAAILARW